MVNNFFKGNFRLPASSSILVLRLPSGKGSNLLNNGAMTVCSLQNQCCDESRELYDWNHAHCRTQLTTQQPKTGHKLCSICGNLHMVCFHPSVTALVIYALPPGRQCVLQPGIRPEDAAILLAMHIVIELIKQYDVKGLSRQNACSCRYEAS